MNARLPLTEARQGPQPVITADGLELRPLRRQDAEALALYVADRRVAEGARSIPPSIRTRDGAAPGVRKPGRSISSRERAAGTGCASAAPDDSADAVSRQRMADRVRVAGFMPTPSCLPDRTGGNAVEEPPGSRLAATFVKPKDSRDHTLDFAGRPVLLEIAVQPGTLQPQSMGTGLARALRVQSNGP